MVQWSLYEAWCSGARVKQCSHEGCFSYPIV